MFFDINFMVIFMKGDDCIVEGMVLFGKDKNGYQIFEISVYMNYLFKIMDKLVFLFFK